VYQFGFTSGVRRSNTNQAEFEYRFARHYSIDTMYGDAGVGRVELFWKLRY
jgi:hypothetical protein